MLPCYRWMQSRYRQVREALSKVLAPLVAAEGGRIYLQELGESEFLVHWAGRYAGSPAVELLHNEVTLPLIQRVAPGSIVRWSSGRLVPAKAELVEPTPST
jgi:hypothetical protein